MNFSKHDGEKCRWSDGEVLEDRLLVWSHKDGRNLTMCSDLLIVTRVVKHHICLSNGDTSSFLRSIICYSPFQMPNMHFTSIMSIMHCTSIKIFKYILVFLWIYIYIHSVSRSYYCWMFLKTSYDFYSYFLSI